MIFDGVCRILDGVAPFTEVMSREWGGVPSSAGPQGPVPVCAANLPNGAQQGGGRLAAASAQTGSVPLGTGATGRIGASEEGEGRSVRSQAEPRSSGEKYKGKGVEGPRSCRWRGCRRRKRHGTARTRGRWGGEGPRWGQSPQRQAQIRSGSTLLVYGSAEAGPDRAGALLRTQRAR